MHFSDVLNFSFFSGKLEKCGRRQKLRWHNRYRVFWPSNCKAWRWTHRKISVRLCDCSCVCAMFRSHIMRCIISSLAPLSFYPICTEFSNKLTEMGNCRLACAATDYRFSKKKFPHLWPLVVKFQRWFSR